MIQKIHSLIQQTIPYCLLLSCCLLFGKSLQAATLTWQGNLSSDWATAGNWDSNTVPTTADEVIIPELATGDYPIISSDAGTIIRLVLENNSQLIINHNLVVNNVDDMTCAWCRGINMSEGSDLTIDQSGNLTVLNAQDRGINIYRANVTVNGTLTVTDATYEAIYVDADGMDISFVNNGTISINNPTGTGIYTTTDDGGDLTFTNGANAIININNTGFHGIYHESRNQDGTTSTVTNDGTITIDGTLYHGILNESRPNDPANVVTVNWTNNGTVNVSNTGERGFYNYNNRGRMYFTNTANSTINLVNNNWEGIFNYNRRNGYEYSPYLEVNNYGDINIEGSGGRAISNETQRDTLLFTNHSNSTIYCRQIGRAGIYNYTNNDNAFLQFVNDGTIDLDTTGIDQSWLDAGIYNRCRLTRNPDTTSTLIMINNGAIEIDSSFYSGVYNYQDNGGYITFTNTGSLDIAHTGRYGIYNYQNRTANENRLCSFNFANSNSGTINIDYTAEQGIYNLSRRDTLTFSNANTINISEIWSDAIRHTADNNGYLTVDNTGDITVTNIASQGTYINTGTGGEVNFNNEGNLTVNMAYQNGCYINNRNGHITVNNSANASFNFNDVIGTGLYLDNINEQLGYDTKLTLDNYGTISVDNAGNNGLYNYISRDTTYFNNHGTINLNNIGNIGMPTNGNNNSTIYLNNTATGVINLNTTGHRGFYNYTDNGGQIICVNDNQINTTNTDRAGCYNYARDGFIDFDNNGTISIQDNVQEAGFYNYVRQEDTNYTTTLDFDNNGIIDIDNITGHGFMLNNSNGVLDFANHQTIDINGASDRGFYSWNRDDNTNFDSDTYLLNEGDILIKNITNYQGMYIYMDRDTLEFVNNGLIDIEQIEGRGLQNSSDRGYLSFTNNGTIAIDTTLEEGMFNEAYRNDMAYEAQLDFVNNGLIDIDSTGYEGMQNFTNRASVNFENTTSGTIEISNTLEEGMENNAYEGSLGFESKMEVVNYGLLDIELTTQAGLRNTSDRGDTVRFKNYGTIEIFDPAEFGIYNQSYINTANDYYSRVFFENHGDITVDSSTYAGIYNHGQHGQELHFHNYNNITVTRSKQAGINNTSGGWSSNYDPKVHFYNEGGTININNINDAQSGIMNYATRDSLYFYNNGTLNISNVPYGIDNYTENDGSYLHFENQANGVLNINDIDSTGIYTHTNLWNSNHVSGIDVINTGTVNLTNIDKIGWYTYNYRVPFVNVTNDGNINISETGEQGIYNRTLLWGTSYTVPTMVYTNNGTIDISNTAHKGMHSFNQQANFDLINNGTIKTNNTHLEGIHNESFVDNDNYHNTFDFDNFGSIQTENSGWEGIKNSNYQGDFIINNSGRIEIDQAGNEGLENICYADSMTFNNYAYIEVRNTEWESIYNSSVGSYHSFNNGICAVIDIDNKLKNSMNKFTNNGMLLTKFDYNNNTTNEAEFVNNGIVEAENGFDFAGIETLNNGSILAYDAFPPIEVTINQVANNVMNNPDGIYTLSGFYTTPDLLNLAGTYSANNNTFTPNYALYGTGTHTIYALLADNVTNCSNSVREVTLTVNPLVVGDGQAGEVVVQARLYLEGAYHEPTGLMYNTLRNDDLLPPLQPFNVAPHYYGGSETAVLDEIPVNAVDWILVEIYTENGDLAGQKAAWLLNNGYITDQIGDYNGEGVHFNTFSPTNAYHVAIRTRNHLDVMTQELFIPNTSGIIDFSHTATVAGGTTTMSEVAEGIYALPSGDIDADGVITYQDYNAWLLELDESNSYLKGDLNFDGNTDEQDLEWYLQNASKISVIKGE